MAVVAQIGHSLTIAVAVLQFLREAAAFPARRIKSMHSNDTADSESMREFAARLGFTRAPDSDDASPMLHSLYRLVRSVPEGSEALHPSDSAPLFNGNGGQSGCVAPGRGAA